MRPPHGRTWSGSPTPSRCGAGRAVRTLLAKLLRGVVGADIPCLTAVIREALLHFSGPQS